MHVRRPRPDYESHATALDRNEVGALLVAAGLGSAQDHALVSLLALNGLRVSEAIGADIDQLGLARGHRTLTITRKGGKIVTIPLAPRTARAIDLVIGERLEGPIFMGSDGSRLDRHAAGRIVGRVARRAGITKPVGPHTLRHAFITAAFQQWEPVPQLLSWSGAPGVSGVSADGVGGLMSASGVFDVSRGRSLGGSRRCECGGVVWRWPVRRRVVVRSPPSCSLGRGLRRR